MIRRFQPCEPQIFRVGDIVEVQLSFVVIPVKAGRRKMLTVLRSLALLDGAYTIKLAGLSKLIQLFISDFYNHWQGEKPQTLTVLPTLRRKVGYGDHNGETSDKRNKMLIDTT